MPTTKRATGMAPELIRMGHDVSIVAWDVPANRARFALECPAATPLWITHTRTAAEIVEKLRVIRRWRPELVYSTYFGLRNLAFLKSAYAQGAPLISEHCELFSAFRSRKQRFLHAWIERRSAVESDGLVCASRYLERAFEQHRGAGRTYARTIYLPYGYPDYLAASGERPTGTAVKNVIFMAALWKNYGVLDVIKAAELLALRRDDFVINIIGDGPARAEAESAITRMRLERRVVLRGYVDEDRLNASFSDARVFLAPLYRTTQDMARCPSKIYYYLPYQKPIVTCAFGDPFDLLQDDGYYYAPGDPASMAACLGRALDESDRFRFRHVRVDEHAWRFRARQFAAWCSENSWLAR